MARVIEVYPGSDGVVRTVKVKTLKGTYHRSVPTTCDRVVLDLLFLRRTCRFFVLCL
ncbi:hypothetical protein T05_10551 [Trichinella murrelli]|uniref:DUF5641 domain-containing protein n=1 Tax=Trichinella murrelli TaxID=144512 RepID=A0A0V0SSX4_9BILA|nr:hypothetical protein T05_10551 [Trichinella murrelli]